jgi:hypothetical protein
MDVMGPERKRFCPTNQGKEINPLTSRPDS